MKLIVGLWALTLFLLVITLCVAGLPGQMMGVFAGMSLGLAVCITCVTLGDKL